MSGIDIELPLFSASRTNQQRSGHLSISDQVSGPVGFELEQTRHYQLNLRLGKKEARKESTDGHLLKEAITEYKKHREEMKAGDEKTWAREDSGLLRWEEKFGDLRLSLLDDAKRKDFLRCGQFDHGERKRR